MGYEVWHVHEYKKKMQLLANMDIRGIKYLRMCYYRKRMRKNQVGATLHASHHPFANYFLIAVCPKYSLLTLVSNLR